MTIEELIAYYMGNPENKGRKGMAFDCKFRQALRGQVERCHPQGYTDCAAKAGVTIECKTGCGWLAEPAQPGCPTNTFPGYDSREEAKEALEQRLAILETKALNGWQLMQKATFVAYAEDFDEGGDMTEVRVFSQKVWLRMLNEFNLIRVKQSKPTGKWGFAIQSYIPTPKFHASQKRYEAFRAARMERGETIEQFAARMGL